MYVINGVSWSAFVGWYIARQNTHGMNNINKMGTHIHDTASHTRRLKTWAPPLSKPQDLQDLHTHQIYVLISPQNHYKCHVLTCQNSKLDNPPTQSYPDTYAQSGHVSKLDYKQQAWFMQHIHQILKLRFIEVFKSFNVIHLVCSYRFRSVFRSIVGPHCS